MTISFFCITSHMTQLFHECVEKKNYLDFYNRYRCDFEVLSEKLKTVDLPKPTMFKYFAHNFMDCFELLLNPNRPSVDDSIITPFEQSVEYAIENRDWNSFYWDYRDFADFVIRKARNQQIIEIYVVEGANKYLSFYDRDCDVAKNNTELYLSKHNGVKIVRPSISHEKNYEVKNVFETSAESKTHNSMAHHEEQVYFTCSAVSHEPLTYEYPSSSRSVSRNQYFHSRAHPYQENISASSSCPSQNVQTDSYRNQNNSSFPGKNSTPLKLSSCLSESFQSDNSHSNAAYYNLSGSKCSCSTCLKPSNERVNHQFGQPPLPQSNQPHGNRGSTIRDVLPNGFSDKLNSHTGYNQQSSSNHSFNKIGDRRDNHKTQSINLYNIPSSSKNTGNLRSNFQKPDCFWPLVPKNSGIYPGKSGHSERSTANIERSKPSEKLNREKYDGQLNNIDEEKKQVLEEAYKNPRSNYFDSLQNPRTSESSGELKAGGCNDTSVYVENIEKVEDDKSLKRSMNEKGHYSVLPKQDSRMPPSSLTPDVLLDNQKNLEECLIDNGHSDSLTSRWSIVSLPREDMDTLKYFELDNTLCQSSDEMDISDVPVLEFEQPQLLMLGDLWSDLDKPEPLQKPALRSDSSVDRGLENWKRYAEDVEQHTTSSVIDAHPLGLKVSEKESSEDEDENATMNRDFERKFQEKTDYERSQNELKRKKEERAEIRRKLEEELRKLDLEDKEEMAMVSNFKTPEQESRPISPAPSEHDVIENVYVLQNTLRSTDTESSGEPSYQEAEERNEVNFNMLLQEQASRQQEDTEKMKKNKVEVLNRTCATLETSGLVTLKPHAGEVEHQPTVNTAEISGSKPINKESLFTQKDLMLKNVDQEGNEKLSTDSMKTEQVAPGESSERLPIFSELLGDLDPIPVPLPKSEKTPCLEDFQLYVENISKQTTESVANVAAAANELLQNDLKNGETSESKLPAIDQHDREGEEEEAQERLNRSVQTQSIRQQKEFEVKRKEWADRKKKLEEDTDSIRKRAQERLISFLNGLKK